MCLGDAVTAARRGVPGDLVSLLRIGTRQPATEPQQDLTTRNRTATVLDRGLKTSNRTATGVWTATGPQQDRNRSLEQDRNRTATDLTARNMIGT